MQDMFPNYSDEDIDAMLPETMAAIITSLLRSTRARNKHTEQLKRDVTDAKKMLGKLEEVVKTLRKEAIQMKERIYQEREIVAGVKARLQEETKRADNLLERLREYKKAKKKVKKARKTR